MPNFDFDLRRHFEAAKLKIFFLNTEKEKKEKKYIIILQKGVYPTVLC